MDDREPLGDKGKTGWHNRYRELHGNPLLQRFTAKQEQQLGARHAGVTNRRNASSLHPSRVEVNTVSAAIDVRA